MEGDGEVQFPDFFEKRRIFGEGLFCLYFGLGCLKQLFFNAHERRLLGRERASERGQRLFVSDLVSAQPRERCVGPLEVCGPLGPVQLIGLWGEALQLLFVGLQLLLYGHDLSLQALQGGEPGEGFLGHGEGGPQFSLCPLEGNCLFLEGLDLIRIEEDDAPHLGLEFLELVVLFSLAFVDLFGDLRVDGCARYLL